MHTRRGMGMLLDQSSFTKRQDQSRRRRSNGMCAITATKATVTCSPGDGHDLALAHISVLEEAMEQQTNTVLAAVFHTPLWYSLGASRCYPLVCA